MSARPKSDNLTLKLPGLQISQELSQLGAQVRNLNGPRFQARKADGAHTSQPPSWGKPVFFRRSRVERGPFTP